MKKKLEVAEWIYVVISLVCYTGGPFPVILSQGGGEGLIDLTPDPTDYSKLQLFFFFNYLVALFLLIIRWKRSLYVFTKNGTIWALILLSLASVIWSADPTTTRARTIALLGNTLFALYLASRYSLRDQLKLLGWSFVIIIILSTFFAIFMPFYGTMYMGVHTGAWRGIFVHKNVFGKVIALGALIFFLLAMDAKAKSWPYWTGLGCCFGLLILTKSSSSMINYLITLATIPIYQTFRWRYQLMIPAIIATCILGGGMSIWFDQNAATIFGSIGKDPTLTGRTDMWPHIIGMIWQRPWFGYGYNGFWNDWNSPGAQIWYTVQWVVPNSHNGFLDILLDLGLFGLIVFAIEFCLTLFRSLNWLRTDKSWLSLWSILLLTYLILGNLTETSLMTRNDIFWLLYMTASFSLAANNISPTEKSSVYN